MGRRWEEKMEVELNPPTLVALLNVVANAEKRILSAPANAGRVLPMLASSRFHAVPSISLTWVEQLLLLRILEKFRDTM